MTTKTNTNYGKCSMFVEGMDMNCPLCKTLVKSGERHECEFKDGKYVPVKTISASENKEK